MVTDLTRRHFAGLCAALGTMPLAGLSSASGSPAFLSAYRDPSGSFGVAALDDAGTVLFTEALPARGHDTVVSPDGRTAVTFARRPGRFALVFDLQQQRQAFAFEAAPGRHFYGHGFFSNDGRLLLATENDYAGERGVMGIYDVQAGYRRIGEFATHGIGPHEALLLADGRTVAIANGGILTHPDYPRQKLNLPTMAPSLAYLDMQTGDLIEQTQLASELHQLSIRHLTQTADGTVWFGGQYEGAPTDDVPLLGRHQRGWDIELIGLPVAQRSMLRQYIGSIKASYDGRFVAVASPRGGIAVTLNARNGMLIETLTSPDICGIADRGAGFVHSSGNGSFLAGKDSQLPFHWDNHLRAA
ncbi:MAG: DUF1513 domain-containing protein [Devosiaceae bacterium]|nr:DUF1513 domain-containing protein [Devosiaceae bacterium MH13]